MALEIKKISKAFDEENVLYDISFKFDDYKVHGVCGRNGSGKTTLLKIISGNILQNSGEIIFSSGITYKDVAYVDNNPQIFLLETFIP